LKPIGIPRPIKTAAARKGITLGEVFRRSSALAQNPNADKYKRSWKKDEQRWRDYLAATFDNQRLDVALQDVVHNSSESAEAHRQAMTGPFAITGRRPMKPMLREKAQQQHPRYQKTAPPAVFPFPARAVPVTA